MCPHALQVTLQPAAAAGPRRLLLQAGLWVASGNLVPLVPGGGRRFDDQVSRGLFEWGVREKMAPMLAQFSREHGLDLGAVPDQLSVVSRVATAALYQHLTPVLATLAERGIKPLLLKGADLDLNVYPEALPRFMADVDLLIRPADVAHVEEAFNRLGFAQGALNEERLRIEPMAPAERAALEANREELCPFRLVVPLPELSPFREVIGKFLSHCPFVVIGNDVHLALSYDVHVSVAIDFEVSDQWQELREITFPGGIPLYGQSFADLLWYVASKMYHEILLLDQYAMRYFVDAVAIVKRFSGVIDWHRLIAICGKYQLHPSLFFTLWHINEVLGPVIPDEVVEACRPRGVDGDRGHDWGDFVPKMLGELSVYPLLSGGEARP